MMYLEILSGFFRILHCLLHLGIRPTMNLIRYRFIWHSMNKDCHEWARRRCLDCQRSKVYKHAKSEQQRFEMPIALF